MVKEDRSVVFLLGHEKRHGKVREKETDKSKRKQLNSSRNVTAFRERRKLPAGNSL